jgi:hypothetical protein
MCFCSNNKEDIAMEHTSTKVKINNIRGNSKYLRYDIIHKEEDPDTMDLQIWYNIANRS